MQTDLSPALQNTTDGIQAQKLLANCVHCGFCTATCPTYQLLGDELDGPRGRIYLIKQMAEGQPATEKTREHLDRCLTCRNCESTCPSGVQYGHLLDIGRKWANQQTPPRPFNERITRWLLKEGLTRPYLFTPAIQLGRFVRPFLPSVLQKKIPNSPLKKESQTTNPTIATQKMLFLEGCVQPGMLPNINQASKRVFAKLGIELISSKSVGCCGAIRLHLNDEEGSLNEMRRNIDAWYAILSSGQATTLVMNASGCGVTIKDYGYLLRNDPNYAKKAKVISDACKDISEVLIDYVSPLKQLMDSNQTKGVVYHPPCTLQHGQQVRGKVESILTQLGIAVNLCEDSHLCCGSAGTYSILQENLSNRLKQQKLDHLLEATKHFGSSAVVSGNVGCITHLQNDQVPVKHWIELIDDVILFNH